MAACGFKLRVTAQSKTLSNLCSNSNYSKSLETKTSNFFFKETNRNKMQFKYMLDQRSVQWLCIGSFSSCLFTLGCMRAQIGSSKNYCGERGQLMCYGHEQLPVCELRSKAVSSDNRKIVLQIPL